MAFMQKQIYKGDGWIVELESGASEVMYDVNAPDVPKVGDEVWTESEHGTVSSVEYVKGFFGRYSAPGYLDATPWVFGHTRAEVEQELEFYGEDEDEGDEDDEDDE